MKINERQHYEIRKLYTVFYILFNKRFRSLLIQTLLYAMRQFRSIRGEGSSDVFFFVEDEIQNRMWKNNKKPVIGFAGDHRSEITWHDFAKVFDSDITIEETSMVLTEHTAWPFGGFDHNARLMKQYFEEKQNKGN